MTATVSPFTTVADEDAPYRLHAAGFHLDMPCGSSELLLWRDNGDVVQFRPDLDHSGFLIAEITANDLSTVLSIVEPDASSH